MNRNLKRQVSFDEALRGQWKTVRRAIVVAYALMALFIIPFPFRSSLPSWFIWSWTAFVFILLSIYLIWGLSSVIRGFFVSLAAWRSRGEKSG